MEAGKAGVEAAAADTETRLAAEGALFSRLYGQQRLREPAVGELLPAFPILGAFPEQAVAVVAHRHQAPELRHRPCRGLSQEVRHDAAAVHAPETVDGR